MQRRTFLGAAAAAICACPGCLAVAAEHGHGQPHWTYSGKTGPEHWGRLAPEYGACGMGREQSPINLTKAIPAVTGNPVVQWGQTPLTVLNNGHTIQVDVAPGSHLILDDETYQLVQFHFHHPSEHTIDGVAYPLEVHFVHKGPAGLAVLGVMFVEGPAHPTLGAIWDLMPPLPGSARDANAAISPAALLPVDPTTWRYAGSLTTPPCSEVVSWAVFRQPVTASPQQLQAFATLFPNNARPVQPLNRRKLLLDVLG
jgi:carbonic anhydrase